MAYGSDLKYTLDGESILDSRIFSNILDGERWGGHGGRGRAGLELPPRISYHTSKRGQKDTIFLKM